MGQGHALSRRALLGAAAALSVGGCTPRDGARHIEGGFAPDGMARGHALRDQTAVPTPDRTRHTQVVIAGGGIAGLAAARALRQAGVEDCVVLELHDSAGGNSRAGALGGHPCPMGAHYLPTPGAHAHEIADWLEELGLRRRVAGRWVYDERHLCHSPQERLYFGGGWQEGLLPLHGVGEATLAQYRRFAQRVQAAGAHAAYALPVFRAVPTPAQRALDAQTFALWLAQEGLDDAHLLWYLDYCCRDEYGAGPARVSAWAGIHYFASRHGFLAPGHDEDDAREGLLTWPEGNGWLATRLAVPLGAERLHTGCSVLRIAQDRHGVQVDVLDHADQRVTRWQAVQCIVALPLFVAVRVVRDPPTWLRTAAERLRIAPWVVVNALLDAPLADQPGAAPAWDNVVHGAPGLGYVDARHQSLDPRPGAGVLTWYHALGDLPDGRAQLQAQPWTHWRDQMLTALAAPHPDLAARTQRMQVVRHGHAMAVPVPQTLAAPWTTQGTLRADRLHFAHADWSGYSVFEEAFTRGHLAGRACAAAA